MKDTYGSMIRLLIGSLSLQIESADLTYDTVAMSMSAQDELDKWQKYIKNKRNQPTRAFNPILTAGDIADQIQKRLNDNELPAQVFKDARANVASFRMYSKTELEFKDKFSTLMQLALENGLPKAEFEASLWALITTITQQAYLDGLSDGGAGGDYSQQDSLIVAELLNDQRQYVKQFAILLYTDNISVLNIESKQDAWFNKSIGAFYYSGLVSANRDAMYEWVIGNTEVHCKTCLALDGQRHRLSEFSAYGYLPQSSKLACKGFYCDCRLKRVKAGSRGNLATVG
jgi:hypothetical protein